MKATSHFTSNAWKRLRTKWQYAFGLLIVLSFILIAISAPQLSPEDPKKPGPIKIVGKAVDFTPRPPTPAAPFGTLPGQLSIYHSLVWGTRSALTFGVSAALFTAVLGMLIGAASAYFRGVGGSLLMQLTDAFLAFPVIAGVVFIHQIITILLDRAGVAFQMTGASAGTSSGSYIIFPEGISAWLTLLSQLNPVMISFILFSWPAYARITNTITQTIMEMDYVQAARALGASHSSIIFRHLIPNAAAPTIIMATRDVGGMVLLQATFTFIGMGGDSLWGMLLVRGRNWVLGPGGNILHFWWLFLPVTVALLLFSIGWTLLGDFLTELLDPREN